MRHIYKVRLAFVVIMGCVVMVATALAVGLRFETWIVDQWRANQYARSCVQGCCASSRKPCTLSVFEEHKPHRNDHDRIDP